MKALQRSLAAVLLGLALSTAFAADVASGKGIVNRVDAGAGTVNIQHEAIAALKWPAMTMDFKVVDPRQLATLKAGQAVRFGLSKDATLGYVISHVEPDVPTKK